MVKIIIELDEALIEKKGNPENLDAEMGGGRNPMHAIIDTLTFSMLKKEMEGGKKEFIVNRETLDEKGKEFFDHMTPQIGALATIMANKDDEKEEA